MRHGIFAKPGIFTPRDDGRVARFKDLKGSDVGNLPSAQRVLYNAVGFQLPEYDSEAVISPVGEEAARNAAVPIREGLNLGYCRAKPGKGPVMHNHDTNETFICMSGTWQASWLNEDGEEDHVELEPLDLISFPAGAIRRFENVTRDDPDGEHILMFVIVGDAPKAELTDASRKKLADAGSLPEA